MNSSNYFKKNEDELMEYYGYEGTMGRLKLRLKFFHHLQFLTNS